MVGGVHADDLARRLVRSGVWRPPLRYPIYGFEGRRGGYGRGGCLECEIERDLRRGVHPREIIRKWDRRGWYPGREGLVEVFWDWLTGIGQRLERRRWEMRQVSDYGRERSVLGVGFGDEFRYLKNLGKRGVRGMLDGIEWVDERIENRAARGRKYVR